MKSSKKVLAEFLGSAGLLIVVVGSGIWAEALSQGNGAITLLANSLATGAGLYALIQMFGPISGAHFNPVVSFAEMVGSRLSLGDFCLYVLAQISGALLGVATTHRMFNVAIVQFSQHDRSDFHLLFSEGIATFGLVLLIQILGKKNPQVIPAAVALYITSAYWCTSSTSFANPAVTIGRSFTDSYSGILWTGAPAFILAQFIGATAAYQVAKILTSET